MERLYFTINLNKFGDQKKQKEMENKTFISITIVFLVFSLIAFAGFYYMKSVLAEKIENRSNLLSNIKKEIKKYQDSGEFLSTKDIERLTRVSTERIFWSRKLVALAEKTSDKIAITHFSFKRNNLSLFGITQVDKKQNEFNLIDEFMVSLKDNKQISSDFDDIKFVKSNRDKEKDVAIMRFQIDLISQEEEE